MRKIIVHHDEAGSATLAGSSSPYLDMLLATELFWRVLDPSTRSGTSFCLCLEGRAERGLKRSGACEVVCESTDESESNRSKLLKESPIPAAGVLER
jgi:hypothetical protein